MNDIYTMEQWQRDRVFAAVPGQEIDQEIYIDMLNCMPPIDLPEEARTNAQRYIFAGFMMGEPYDSRNGHLRYLAFGNSGNRYYYLGLYERD